MYGRTDADEGSSVDPCPFGGWATEEGRAAGQQTTGGRALAPYPWIGVKQKGGKGQRSLVKVLVS